MLGHLPDGRYLAAVALGAVLFSFLYWGLGFLRMGTTGLVAQAWGQEDRSALGRLIIQSLSLALLLGLALQLLRPLVPSLVSLLDGSQTAQQLAAEYVAIRLWSAPAALAQYVVLGVAIGLGRTRVVLWLLILGNGINIVLDLWFVLGLGMTSQGVALATLAAEVTAALVGVSWLLVTCKRLKVPIQRPAPDPVALKKLIKVNSDLFIRTLALLLALAFFTRQGASQGNEILAANTLLMQLVMLSSYLLDGFAQAVEGRFGNAFARSKKEALDVYRAGLFLSVMTAAVLTLAAWLGGSWLVYRLTDLAEIRLLATTYLPWLWIILPVSLWCYLYDGVFIGATWTAAMRNSLVVSLACFLLAWWLLQDYGNHGLWAAFLIFNALRGLTLGWVFQRRFYK